MPNTNQISIDLVAIKHFSTHTAYEFDYSALGQQPTLLTNGCDADVTDNGLQVMRLIFKSECQYSFRVGDDEEQPDLLHPNQVCTGPPTPPALPPVTSDLGLPGLNSKLFAACEGQPESTFVVYQTTQGGEYPVYLSSDDTCGGAMIHVAYSIFEEEVGRIFSNVALTPAAITFSATSDGDNVFLGGKALCYVYLYYGAYSEQGNEPQHGADNDIDGWLRHDGTAERDPAAKCRE